MKEKRKDKHYSGKKHLSVTGGAVNIEEQKKLVPSFNKYNWFQLAILLVGIFIIYSPTLNKEFIYFDDDWYIYNNPYLHPFSLSKIGEIFSEFYGNQYSPIPTTFLGFLSILSGDSPFLYNLSAILLHVMCTVMVFWFAYRLVRNPISALVVAAFFGITPLNVESVAWASAVFKTGFYSIFFIASLISYTYFLSTNKLKHLAVSFLFFVLSFLSKEQAVALVLSLFCIDFLNRRNLLSKKVILEKLPFLIASAVFGIITLMAAKSDSDELAYNQFDFAYRILFACYALGEYFIKLLIPYELSLYYPYPDIRNLSFWFYLHPVIIAVLVYVFIRTLKKNRSVAFGILFFSANILFTLVLQIVSVRGAVMADRYSYIPSIGIYFLAGVLLNQLWTTKYKSTAIIIVSMFAIYFSVVTFVRSQVWQNSLTLWNDVISKYKTVPTAYNNRGVYYMNKKNFVQAIDDFSKAIGLDRKYSLAYYNRGVIYSRLKRYAEALTDYNKAIELRPNYAMAYNNRGIAFVNEKKNELALSDFNKAIELKADYAEAYVSRGNYFRDENKIDEAWNDYERALKINPDLSSAYLNRGILRAKVNSYEEALVDFNKAIELSPDDTTGYSNRGHVMVVKQNFAAAMKDYNKVIELNPDNAEAYYSRGVIYTNEKRSDDALREYSKAIELNPDYVGAYYNRGIIYFDKKNFDEAIKNYTKAIELKPDYAEAYFNRALSEFYSGRKDKACIDMKRANSLGYKPAEDVVGQICR